MAAPRLRDRGGGCGGARGRVYFSFIPERLSADEPLSNVCVGNGRSARCLPAWWTAIRGWSVSSVVSYIAQAQ